MLTDVSLRIYNLGVAFFKSISSSLDFALLLAYTGGLAVWLSLADASMYYGLVHFLPFTYALKRTVSVSLPLAEPETPDIRMNEDSYAGTSRQPYFEEHKDSISVEDLN
jgi:hypothetical protein